LIPLLQSLPDRIETNVTVGYPLVQSALFGYIDLWLQVQQRYATHSGGTVQHLDVEVVLGHPLCGVAVEERQRILQHIHDNQWLEVPSDMLLLNTASYPSFFEEQKTSDALLQ